MNELHESELHREKYLLSEAESARIFREHIIPFEFPRVAPATNPTVHFIGAQPGSGKSKLQGLLHSQLTDSPDSIMAIEGDAFRSYHPHYARLLENDDAQAAYYTDLDAGRWTEKAIDYSLEIRPDVLLEGTLRNPATTIHTAQMYKSKTFRSELHLLAVHEFFSRARIIGRYVDQTQRSANKRGRYTIRRSHDIVYTNLIESVETIADAKVFDQYTIYNAHSVPILKVASEQPGVTNELLAALKKQRQNIDGDDKEILLAKLEQYEQQLQQLDRHEILNDLYDLRTEIKNV